MRFSPQSILRENLGAEMDAETHSDAPGCFLHGRRPFPTPSAQVGEGIGPGRASAHRTSLWRPPREVGRPQQGGPLRLMSPAVTAAQEGPPAQLTEKFCFFNPSSSRAGSQSEKEVGSSERNQREDTLGYIKT